MFKKIKFLHLTSTKFLLSPKLSQHLSKWKRKTWEAHRYYVFTPYEWHSCEHQGWTKMKKKATFMTAPKLIQTVRAPPPTSTYSSAYNYTSYYSLHSGSTYIMLRQRYMPSFSLFIEQMNKLLNSSFKNYRWGGGARRSLQIFLGKGFKCRLDDRIWPSSVLVKLKIQFSTPSWHEKGQGEYRLNVLQRFIWS